MTSSLRMLTYYFTKDKSDYNSRFNFNNLYNMRERNRSPAAVELQQISNLVVNRNHLLDKPPSKQILDRI